MALTKWVLDPTHSEIQFKVKHLMITTVTGSFQSFTAEAEADDHDFSNATISFSADVASIFTGNEQRDGHLKGADFFDAETYPKLSFADGKLTSVDNDGSYTLSGNLTIKGTTKAVQISVEFGGVGVDPWGNTKAGFTLTGKISRKEYGLTWDVVTEAGSVMVSDEVRIHAEIQLLKTA